MRPVGNPAPPSPRRPGVAHRLDDVIARAPALEAILQQRVAALGLIGREVLGRVPGVRVGPGLDGLGHFLRRRLHHLHVPDRAGRRMIAGTHAGRAQHADAGTERGRKLCQEFFGTSHRAGQALADAHRDRRRRRPVLHHVEMRIEGRNLVDLGQRELHLLRERRQVSGREIAVMVLNEMQVLDQKVALARARRPAARARPPVRAGSTCRPFGVFGGLRRPLAGFSFTTIVFTQNSPTIFPSALTSIESAAGTLGRPGMVMISPQIATTNSAPAERRTSRTGMT